MALTLTQLIRSDYRRYRAAGASHALGVIALTQGLWATTVYRPTVIYGAAPGNNMNPTIALAVYAAVLRARGEPLHFPGEGGQPVLREAVDAGLVGRAVVWGATTPAARNETFNVTNGDVFVWETVWPTIARAFGMEPGENRPFSFARELRAFEPEWAALVDRHALAASKNLTEFVGYNSMVYTDLMLSSTRRTGIAALNSTIKLRQAGFAECMDSEDMFRTQFEELQARGRIPPRA